MSTRWPELDPSSLETYTQVAGTGDHAAIFDCMRVCFNFEPDPARWHHLHVDNPVGPSLFGLVRDSGQVVSGVALLPRRAVAFGREGILNHVIDSMTRPEWRGRGVRSRATDAARRLAREGGSIGVFSFANELSLPGSLRQQRRRAVADAPVLMRPLRPLAAVVAAVVASAPAIRLGLGRPAAVVPASAAAGPIADGAAALVEAADARSGWRTPSFEDAHARLFREAEAWPPITLRRDTGYLPWRYVDAPGSPYVQRDARPSRELEATIVARSIDLFGIRLVLVMEWAWRSGARREGVALLRDLARVGRAAGAHAMSALAMPGTPQRRALYRHGFLPAPSRLAPKRVVFNVAPDDGAEDASAWYRPESWNLSWGDGFLF